jgi:hypothetical protein
VDDTAAVTLLTCTVVVVWGNNDVMPCSDLAVANAGNVTSVVAGDADAAVTVAAGLPACMRLCYSGWN